MDSMERLNLKRYKSALGEIPNDFFLKVDDNFISLYYKGKGFKEITEPGGEKTKGDSALIRSSNISNTWIDGMGGIVQDIKSSIQKTLNRVKQL